jgi:hypothetical protein
VARQAVRLQGSSGQARLPLGLGDAGGRRQGEQIKGMVGEVDVVRTMSITTDDTTHLRVNPDTWLEGPEYVKRVLTIREDFDKICRFGPFILFHSQEFESRLGQPYIDLFPLACLADGKTLRQRLLEVDRITELKLDAGLKGDELRLQCSERT